MTFEQDAPLALHFLTRQISTPYSPRARPVTASVETVDTGCYDLRQQKSIPSGSNLVSIFREGGCVYLAQYCCISIFTGIVVRPRLIGMALLNGLTVAQAVRRGDWHRDGRRWGKAASAYQWALKLDPSLTGIWVQYGHALKEQGDRDGAEESYQRAISLGLDDADIHLQMGHLLKMSGRRRDAIAAYARALARNPHHADVVIELQRLGWRREDFRSALASAAEPPTKRQDHSSELSTLAFDITDIVHFVSGSRRPTGIQRVQQNVVASLLDRPPPGVEIMLVSFSDAAGGFIEIPNALFRELVVGIAERGDDDDTHWRHLLGRLAQHVACANDAEFPRATRLINLGSSWAFANYFLAVRKARRASGLIYIAFIHDCIPILLPDYFVPELQRDFREWLGRTLVHSDGMIANSQATARDVVRVSSFLGYSAPDIAVVTLDAPFTASSYATGNEVLDPRGVLTRLGLTARGFVLFVGTIEPRKNHLLAFEAWGRLLAERGAHGVPDLVCVGGRGWRNGPILNHLEQTPHLARKVHLLYGLSDEDLAVLYRCARFTLYPSSYEGWGLPVTESLSMGRVALVSRVSSLPEAGGEFAEYFDLEDQNDLAKKLVRLIDDDLYLEAREGLIARAFRPRHWSQIAADIVSRCLDIEPISDAGIGRAQLAYGTFVRLARDPAGAVSSGVQSGEGLRTGPHWGELTQHCAWFADDGTATLEFEVANPRDVAREAGPLHMFALIHAEAVAQRPDEDRTNEDLRRHLIFVACGSTPIGFYRVEEGRDRWIDIPIPRSAASTGAIEISFEVRAQDRSLRCGRAAGLIGAFVCGEHDAEARQRLVEGIALGAIHDVVAPRSDAAFLAISGTGCPLNPAASSVADIGMAAFSQTGAKS